MGNIFSASEIVELGIQIEKNGRDFYSAVAAKAKDSAAEGKFKFLAGEEEKHIKIFQKILEETAKYEPQGLDADEYLAYMNSLAGEHVFVQKNQGAEFAKKAKSDKEAIEMGMAFEKDSIIFYTGMKKVVPEYDLKVIDQLIEQEELHLKMLSDLRHNLL